MILKYLNTNRPAVLFLLPIFGGILWLPFFLEPQPEQAQLPSPYVFIFKTDLILSSFTGGIIALGLSTLTGILLNNIVINSDLTDRTSYVFAFFYVTIESCLRQSYGLYSWQFALLLFCIVLWLLLKIFNQSHIADISFQCGILMGILTLIYPPGIIYFLIIFIFIQRFRTFYWREWLFPLLGSAIVFLFYYIYKLAVNQPLILFYVIQPNDLLQWFNELKWPLFMVGGLTLLSVLFFLGKIQRAIMHARKQRYLLLLTLIIIMVFVVTINTGKYARTGLELLFIPISIITGYYAAHVKRTWFAELIFLGLCASQFIKYGF